MGDLGDLCNYPDCFMHMYIIFIFTYPHYILLHVVES